MNDLNALHVFLALMQTHSTQRAAQKLGRSQSYVSKVLAQLRDDLADPLFVRSSEGLSPTTYALSIEPKVRAALTQLDLALEPECFDPSKIDKVTLHIVEPYLVQIGHDIIKAIRRQSQAVIELRSWVEHSEQQILNEQVDIGLHVMNDKPQTFYQQRVHSGSGYFEGNLQGEYIKFIVSGVNEHTDHYKKLDPSITTGIIVDNLGLLSQLMEDGYTLRYEPYHDPDEQHPLNVDLALITKASLRHAQKQQWLSKLLVPILDNYVKQRQRINS